MEIYTEQAITYDECLEKIHAKHGQNIQVLRQKKVRIGGILGFFEKDGIEINFMTTRETFRPYPISSRPSNFENEKALIIEQAVRSSPHLAQKVPRVLSETQPVKTAQETHTTSIQMILDEVKKLSDKIEKPSEQNERSASYHETLTKIEELLELNDFSISYIKNIMTRLRSQYSLEDLNDYDSIQDNVIQWIGESIEIAQSQSNRKPKIIILVGPTGVGKTTTVAKLSAAYKLGAAKGTRPESVRVITIDNYRIGAKQQIETYGNIMNIPVSCAETIDDLSHLLALHQDVDTILIDTIGKSPKDYAKIAEMRYFLDIAGRNADIHLAMSATTKASDMREIIQQYETFGFTSVIITKFDETTRVGNIISILSEKKKPIVYITTGQRVPHDFEKASVVRFLINLEGFKINRSNIESLFPVSDTRFEWR